MKSFYQELLRDIASPPRRFDASQFVYHQGDAAEELYLIHTGIVRLARLSPDGHEATLAHLEAGQCFGETEVLLGQEQRECFAQAVCPTHVQIVRPRELTPYVRAMLHDLALFRLFRAQLWAAEMIGQPPAQRVASLLRYLAPTGSTVRLSQEEIGMTVDCTREVVAAALRRLVSQGAVALKRGSIQVLDPTLLG